MYFAKQNVTGHRTAHFVRRTVHPLVGKKYCQVDEAATVEVLLESPLVFLPNTISSIWRRTFSGW